MSRSVSFKYNLAKIVKDAIKKYGEYDVGDKGIEQFVSIDEYLAEFSKISLEKQVKISQDLIENDLASDLLSEMIFIAFERKLLSEDAVRLIVAKGHRCLKMKFSKDLLKNTKEWKKIKSKYDKKYD